jgi:hypothetical protein
MTKFKNEEHRNSVTEMGLKLMCLNCTRSHLVHNFSSWSYEGTNSNGVLYLNLGLFSHTHRDAIVQPLIFLAEAIRVHQLGWAWFLFGLVFLKIIVTSQPNNYSFYLTLKS